jgi:hypothetical protein
MLRIFVETRKKDCGREGRIVAQNSESGMEARMRDLIINKIKGDGWLDCFWMNCRRQDNQGQSYEEYLRSLDDENLLAAFVRVKVDESKLENWGKLIGDLQDALALKRSKNDH